MWRENAERIAKTTSAGTVRRMERSLSLGKYIAPNFRYGARRYKNTADGWSGGMIGRRLSNGGSNTWSSSLSLEKSKSGSNRSAESSVSESRIKGEEASMGDRTGDGEPDESGLPVDGWAFDIVLFGAHYIITVTLRGTMMKLPGTKVKRQIVRAQPWQTRRLRNLYERNAHPSEEERNEVAIQTGLFVHRIHISRYFFAHHVRN
jgi:hypothetical protein